MARFDAIVFDFDGVLAESVDVKTRAFAELYRPYGPDIERAVVAYHLAHGGLSRFEKFRHYHRELLRQPLSKEEERALGERFSRLVEDAVVAAPWVRGAREFLEAHHRDLPFAVASGTPTEELRRVVERRGIAGFFRAIRGSPARKSAILRDLLAQFGVAPTRMLMIGDAITDYEGAAEAGTAFLGVGDAAAHPFPPGTPVVPDLSTLSSLVFDPA